jgi:hypothetical protein
MRPERVVVSLIGLFGVFCFACRDPNQNAQGKPDAATQADAPAQGDAAGDKTAPPPDSAHGLDASVVSPDAAVAIAPTISISSPAPGALVLGDDPERSVPVAFTVSNFTLMAPGACRGLPNCGHVHLVIDQQACNASGAAYNNEGATSTLDARFASCATPTGPHAITLQLHNDDHSPVRDASGAVVHSEHRRVFTCAPGTPCLVVTDPPAGATVNIGADPDKSVPIAFSVQGLTLKAPGSCGGDPNCGHVHVLVDGDSCNSAGVPYNNAGQGSPINVKLAACPEPTGPHVVAVELHKDDHSPLQDAAGNLIEARTWFTAVPAGSPAVSIVSHWGESVLMGLDPDKTMPFDFTVKNFALKAPGTCGGAAGCGHVHLLVDGEACNDTGAPYNNAGAASPIRAKLARCARAAGPHVVTVALHNDDHSAVKDAAGRPVAAHTAVNALPSDGTPAIAIDWPKPGAVITPGADPGKSVPVHYSVQNFILKAPGTCGNTPNCGHIHLEVDSAACNDTGLPYNNAGTAGPMAAKLALCPQVTGPHKLRIALHKDDHSPLMVGDGQVAAEVDVTVCAPGQPCVGVVWPPPNAVISSSSDTDKSVGVDYVVSNFRLKQPGNCAGAARCGHVHLQVNGNTCNGPGLPYNNAGAAGPIPAKLALCPMAAGAHRIAVQLHNNDHSPVEEAVRSEIQVTAK